MKVQHRRAHLRIWLALAVLLALGLGAGIALKQPQPAEPGALAGGKR